MRGSIERRGNGYRVDIHLGYDEAGKRIRYRQLVSTKKAAEAVLRAKMEEFETEGRIGERTDDSLQGYIGRHLDSIVSQRVKSRTLEYYRELLRLYIDGSDLGRKPMRSITVLDIEEHYAGLQERVSADAVRRVHVVIKAGFARACRTREIAASPAVYVELPAAPEKRPMTLLHLEDFPAFMGAAMQDRLAAMWALALSTGMRPEEYFGLRWADVDGRTVSISRVLVRPRKLQDGQAPWELQSPKTKGSGRKIRIDEQVAFLLRQHHTQQAEERLLASEAYHDQGFVFCDEIGDPLQHVTIARRFKRLCAKAGLGTALTLYSMRHSCATALMRKRESAKVVADLLGHSSVKRTLDTYTHTTEDLMHGAVSTMARAMFDSQDAAPHAQPSTVIEFPTQKLA